MNTQVTCRKVYPEYPFAHRQPEHDGHCALIHGHNWSFALTFIASRLDPLTGFVIDFGKLKFIREWLDDKFDHTLVLNNNDPRLDYLQKALELNSMLVPPAPMAKIITVPNCGAEGLAQYVFEQVNLMLASSATPVDCRTRGVKCIRVEVSENSRNSAIWEVDQIIEKMLDANRRAR